MMLKFLKISEIVRFLSCLFLIFFFWGTHSVKAQTDPTLLFAKGIGNEYKSGGDFKVNCIKIDASGNRYVTGSFQRTADFDPGAGTANLTSASNSFGSNDIFLAKYDASGNYVWAKAMGGTSNEVGNSLALDGSGNVLVTGFFTGTADFNPSALAADTAYLSSAGTIVSDIFFAKYDASGNYVWAKRLGGTQGDYANSIVIDGSGNMLLTGYYNSKVDFDPGADTAYLSLKSAMFLAKYDASGNYVWAKAMGGGTYCQGLSLALDGSDNVVILSNFGGTVDFDPGADSVKFSSLGTSGTDIILAKYDASGNYVWAKRMGGTVDDRGSFLAIDGSGNLLLTGYFTGTADFDPGFGTANLASAGGTDIFLAKYDASGNYLWAKAMGGTGADQGNSLALDGSGNMYITGNSDGAADFDPGTATANLTSAGSYDIFLAKYDSSGNYVWAKAIGGTGTDIGNSLSLDGSGNAVVTGTFNGTVDFDPSAGTANLVPGSTYINSFIASYTTAAGSYNSALILGSRYGAGSDIKAFKIIRDGSGNLYITGSFAGAVDFDPGADTANLTSAGSTDIFLAKYDASGNYLWAKAMGGTNNDVGNSLVLDGIGNVLLAGFFSTKVDFDPGTDTANFTSAGLTDIFLAKYDASGNYLWAKAMGGTGADSCNTIALDGSGNMLVTGYFTGTADFNPSALAADTANLRSAGGTDIFLAKYESSGNYLWAKRMGGTGTDAGYSLALDGSGNVLLTGTFNGTADFNPSALAADTANLRSAGGTDIFLAKYDASGNYVWAKRMGGSSTDNATSLATDGSGNLLLTGTFSTTADFNPSALAADTANLRSAGVFDIFLAKYDGSGNYVWAKRMGGTGADVGNSLALDGSGNVLVTGAFIGTADFNPSALAADTANLRSAAGSDIFLAKYDSSGNYVWAKAMGGTGADVGNSLVLDGSGNAVVTGIFNGTADFDPGAGTYNLTSMSGSYYSFIAAYGAISLCTNPTAGGSIEAAQSGTNPFTPSAFTNSAAASGQTGTIEYKWQSSITSNSLNFTDILSSNAATYTAGALTVTTWFKRLARVSCSADWTAAAESNVIEVTVNAINTWTGATNNSFNTGTNWSLGTVPTTSETFTITTGNPQLNVDFTVGGNMTISGTGTLTINAGKTLSVEVGGTADFGGKLVTVKSDETGSGSIGVIAGTLNGATNVTVERYIPNNNFRSWRLLAAPTYGNGQTINGAWQEGNTALGNSTPGYGTQITGTGSGFDGVSPSPSMYRYNGTALEAVTNTGDAIATNQGYFIYVRGDRTVGMNSSTSTNSPTTLRTNGALHQGTQTSATIPANTYGLVGNPFASAINFLSLPKTGGVTNAFYIWDAKKQSGNSLGMYQTFSSTNSYVPTIAGGSYSTINTNTTIQSGQAFFVYANANAGTVEIPESSKVASTGTMGYKNVSELVKIDSRLLSITGATTTMADANVVVFDAAYSNAVDGDDAIKFSNNGENLGILKAGKTLAVEGHQPVVAADTLFFKMWNMQAHTYQLELIPQNLGTQNLVARLEDSYLNTSTTISLLDTSRINFTVNATAASYASNRFRIVFTPSVVLPVNFISIAASRKATNVLVSWKVGNELNIHHYEVERSTDGRNFVKAGSLAATGVADYSLLDANAPAGTLFYRVKSVGIAGEIKYSAVVKLSAEKTKPGYAVAPNPIVGGEINVQFKNQPAGKYQLKLLNNVGQQIQSNEVNHAGGNGTQSIQIPAGLARGAYQLEIISADKTSSTETIFINN